MLTSSTISYRPVRGPEKRSTSTHSKWIIYLAVAIFPVIECIQGYIFKGDTSKALTNLLSALIIATFITARSTKHATRKTTNLLTLTLAVGFFALTLSKGIISGEIQYDIFATIRSILLGYSTYSLSQSLPDHKKQHILNSSAKYLWTFITVCILLSGLISIGLYTYEEYSAGHKFYFPSVNELTFVYISCFIALYAHLRTTMGKFATTILTILCFSIIGNKAFIPLLFLIFATSIYLNSKKRYKLLYISIFTIVPIIFIASGNQHNLISSIVNGIIYILSKYSSGAEKFSAKLSYLNVFSALISERDMLVGYAIELFNNRYDAIDTLIGINLSEYGRIYGLKRGVPFSFSENDIVDIFMSYGIIGLLLFCSIMIDLYRVPAAEGSITSKNLKKTLVILFAASGALTGHVYLFGFTCFIFSLFCGLLSSKDRYPSQGALNSSFAPCVR